ncbi:hypothetical protein [Falsiroseomonas sp. E2-1-a20]|uniref:hypothetical protein n=1 Tax=Falsiroseomonas sp. E2-1-a20 TaxID=3239300 RepID=UPI003F39B7B7
MSRPLVWFAACLGLAHPALAQWPDPSSWLPLERRFESTGGGGWMIDGYDPVLAGGRCRTNFLALGPGGERVANIVEWEAVAIPGGILCRDGRWRGQDGQGAGTTPLQVFLRADGARFRSP